MVLTKSTGNVGDCKNCWRLLCHGSRQLCLVLLAMLMVETVTAETRAGFARVDITPPVGFRVAGNYFESLSKGVNDPLHARVMYVGDEGERALVVSLDVCSIGRTASDPIRASIHGATGVPIANIIVSATHNHAGPEYYGTLRDYLHNKAVEEHGKDPAEPIDYVEFLVRQLTDACQRAVHKAVPATFSVGETNVNGVAFNRRFHMKDGSVRMNPGFGNADMVRVAGPVDTRLPVLLVSHATTKAPIGMYTTFAMHTATYGDLTKFGADFPGVIDQRMRARFGDDFVALFGEGTAGDINHLDYVGGTRPDKWSVYQKIGNRLADAIEELLPRMKIIRSPFIRVGQTIEPVPLQSVREQELAEAPGIVFAPPGERTFLERVAAWKVMNTHRLRQRDGENLQVELQSLAVGDQFAILSMPHEVFVELGMMIRDGSPFPVTAVISLAQDLDFYVPTKKAFVEGSYEVTTSSIQPGGGEQIANAAIDLLKDTANRPGQN